MTTPLAFPVLAVGGAPDDDEKDVVGFFLGPDDFFRCSSWELQNHARDGMLLLDSAGDGWMIESVQNLRMEATFREWVLWLLGLGLVTHVIAYQLMELGPAPIDTIKDRLCTLIAENPDDWRRIGTAAGDAATQDEELAALRDKVRQAQSVPQIINAIWETDLPG